MASMGLAAAPFPLFRSPDDQRMSSDRVSLFGPLSDLELQGRPPLSAKRPSASYKFPRRVRSGRLRRPEKAETLISSVKLTAPINCVGKPLLCQ
jgi:hypothetical protein